MQINLTDSKLSIYLHELTILLIICVNLFCFLQSKVFYHLTLDKLSMKEETKNEKLILEAAEEEFLLKGYDGAKTTAIARRAGVTHAMLHYYYRTKKNLFQRVFQEKAQMVANSFETVFDENLPFEATIRLFVEKHFDFVMANPGLINFVYNETRTNSENIALLQSILRPKIEHLSKRIEKLLEGELSKKTIKPVKPTELLVRVMTLNLSASLALIVTGETILGEKLKNRDEFLKNKREDNVRYIFYSLRDGV